MGVYLGAGETVDDYSAMQGPCSSGFHIPLKSERQSVYSIWTALGGGASDGTNFGIALKLPFGGGRDRSNAAVSNNSEWGYYRSATADSGRAYALDFKSSSIDAQSYDVRAIGNQIRPFKDIPSIPTVSWTKLYGTSIEAGGIFRNSTDGLISLSSNGAKRITIADKNLGATTVWNSGDALSENNCGYFYQRGNNYGFQYTGTIPNQSSTQVNASAYGPGNYYSSDTFIKGAWNWDSSINLNLRGGETGIQPKTVYQELKNAYIGEYVPNFATQGPAPDGFHVPLQSEWQSVYDKYIGLGLSGGVNFVSFLKVPLSGDRARETSNVELTSTYTNLWCSDLNSNGISGNTFRAYEQSGGVISIGVAMSGQSQGNPVRPFKDKSVAPTSTWDVLYDGSSTAYGAGIFHSVSDGLISLSNDGQTWITMADKNLGATTVYNYGDTLSEANCGKFYQWGNNYGFPRAGNVTTSSTQVNASSYGPGNYYNSSTFITRSSSPITWDNSGNKNLRGGEDGNVPV